MACGATVWFAKSDALKGTLVDTLQEVRPTMFLGVPRVWEKIQDKVEMQINEMKGFKRALTKWAQVHAILNENLGNCILCSEFDYSYKT